MLLLSSSLETTCPFSVTSSGLSAAILMEMMEDEGQLSRTLREEGQGIIILPTLSFLGCSNRISSTGIA